jgi:hypothetical protein
MNITETVKHLKTGKLVAFNYANPRSYFKMCHGDAVIMLTPASPITATVKSVQPLEEFERQFNTMEFSEYEEN